MMQNDNFFLKLIEEYQTIDVAIIEESLKKKLVEKFRDKLLLNANLEIENFLFNLSEIDKISFFKLKITDVFNITTPNRLYNELINDEILYTEKILKYLEKIKLGNQGRGVLSKDILENVGGNPTILRNILLNLDKNKLVFSTGKTRTKSWVLIKYKSEASKKWKEELSKIR